MFNSFYQKFEIYQEKSLTHRRFKHKDILPLINDLPFEKKLAGQSFEKRSIHQISIGNGSVNVLLWSQMHGNEATATMALFDIFNFFQAENDGFDDYRNLIKEKLTLHFVPMLNPDGAEGFIRRTAQGIDMNRDARVFQTPESQILKKLQVQLKPLFSFNLHDQDVRYAAGNTGKQVAIAFLATAYNETCDWNENRTRAMQVICELNDSLQDYIPGKVGRFSDEFEPRAFGDNIQKWGSSLILVESGGFDKDREKQYLRKLNFCILLEAFQKIAEERYLRRQLAEYEALPLNNKCLFDLIIRNVLLKNGDSLIHADLGILLNEKNTQNANSFIMESTLDDLGDLSVYYGIEEFDAKELLAEPVHKYPDLGYEYEVNTDWYDGPALEKNATFVLSKNETPEFLVLNGKLINLH